MEGDESRWKVVEGGGRYALAVECSAEGAVVLVLVELGDALVLRRVVGREDVDDHGHLCRTHTVQRVSSAPSSTEGRCTRCGECTVCGSGRHLRLLEPALGELGVQRRHLRHTHGAQRGQQCTEQRCARCGQCTVWGGWPPPAPPPSPRRPPSRARPSRRGAAGRAAPAGGQIRRDQARSGEVVGDQARSWEIRGEQRLQVAVGGDAEAALDLLQHL